MVGKLGLAAKLFLGTTVLAGGGAGTWYVASNGMPSYVQFGRADGNHESDADAKSLAATADLDAVASAWGDTPQSNSTSTPDSSPVARSAVTKSDSSAGEPATPKVGGRYTVTDSAAESEIAHAEDKSAVAAASQSSEVVAEQDVATEESAEPTPAIKQQAVATEKSEPAQQNAEVTEAEQPIARGQEPKEDEELRALTGETGGAELQPLSSARQNAPSAVSGDSARDAFRDTPAAAPSGRYTGSSASTNTAPADASRSGVVNPFSAGGTASPQSATNAQTVEPLPRAPVSKGAPAELPPANELQPLQASAGNLNATSAVPRNDLRETRPIEDRSASRTYPRPLPVGTDDLSNNGLPADQLAGQNTLGTAAESDGAGRPGEKALEGPQKPALEIQKFAPGEIQVGKPAKFVVRVRNIGTQPAEGVLIRDQVPQGTKLVSTTPDSQNDNGELVWDLGKLSPGEDRTVEMQVMPVTEGELGSVATVSYSAQASVKTKCTMPQLAIRMTAPAKVMIGQEQRVKIELRNPGSGDATGVMLFENVPQNVKHASGPALEFDIGTLKAGETRELELVLTAEKAGKTVNVLSARADGNLQVQQQVEFEVIAPGLTVGVDGPERRYLERPATYEVSVENPGTAPAHDVKIVTKLPKGLRFVRANNMGEYDANTHAVYWSLAELPEGERGTVELVAMPIEAGPQTLDVETKAGQGLSDQTQQQILIDGLAAIMFEVKDLEDPIEVGGETGYEIRVVNQGTKAATNVQVAVSLPPGMQLVSAEGETQHTEQRGAVVFEPLAQLAAKADTVYRIRAQGTAAGDQRVTVQVNTDDLGQPIRREESTTVFGDE